MIFPKLEARKSEEGVVELSACGESRRRSKEEDVDEDLGRKLARERDDGGGHGGSWRRRGSERPRGDDFRLGRFESAPKNILKDFVERLDYVISCG